MQRLITRSPEPHPNFVSDQDYATAFPGTRYWKP